MTRGSDNCTRGTDRGFRSPGVGLTPTFRCGRCDGTRTMIGCGMRKVGGLRVKVCGPCKEAIDAKAGGNGP